MSKENIDVNKPILDKNDQIAAENRKMFEENNVLVLDLMSSPGSGKTSLISATINALKDEYNFGVIEGDIASDVDTQAIKKLGVEAVQINTGGMCHLESELVADACKDLDIENLDIIIIENVGNLICPVSFDLGEDAKIMILSVPEGDDKPIKYPGIFQATKAIIVNKIDTLSAFDFDEDAFEKNIENLNPHAPVFKVSATKGDGIDEWVAWVREQIENKKRA